MEQVETGTRRRARKPAARVDRSGQEKVQQPEVVKERLDHLIKLHTKAKDAGEDLSSAIKAVAEKSGFLASVVRKIVVAKAGEEESYEEKVREAEQLSLLFTEVGE